MNQQQRNRSQGSQDERDVAEKLGAVRWLANTGGPEDLRHPELAIQVKGRRGIAGYITDGMTAAKVAASTQPGKLACLALVDHRGRGKGKGYYIVFELDEWAAYHGYGGASDCV